MDRWIVIPRWNEFQHYTDRDPIWIKNYLRLLHDVNYMRLTLSQRGILHGLWMLYAATSEALSETEARRELVRSGSEARRWQGNLEALNDAGFIEFAASKPLALTRARARSRERELEKEKKGIRSREKPHAPQPPAHANVGARDPFSAIEVMIRNGVITDTVDLDAEIAGYRLNGELAASLHAMLKPLG